MNIGYLLRTFPQLSQTFILNEIDELERCGHPVTLAAIYRPGEGIASSLRRFEKKTLYWFDIDKSRLGWIAGANLRRLFASPKRYLELFRGHRADGMGQWLKQVALTDYFVRAGVTHIHTHFAWEQVDMLRFIKKLTGMPFSLTLHAADIYSETHNLTEAVRDSAFTLTISEYNRRNLISDYGLPPDKIRVVHCGVNLDDFPVLHSNQTDTPKVVSIGRMVEKKGFDLLLRAFQVLKEKEIKFQAKLIGDGPLLSELKNMSRHLGLDECVTFTGALPHDVVKDVLRNCDVFALACRRTKDGDIDGIPVVLMEAMAAGHPVVSTRLSGVPELVAEDCGYLAEPEDIAGLAEGLIKLIRDHEHAQRMGKRARKMIQKEFTIQGQVDGLLQNIREAHGGAF